MRSTLACSLALVLLLGCSSGEDKVETDDPAVTQDDDADDDTADDDGSAGTGGQGNDDDDAQGGTTGNEPDGGTESDTGGAGGSGGTGAGECPRPEADYTLFGAECDLADFDCEDYFHDECGCGCDDVSETMCRPDDEYVALGDTCDVVRFTCDEGAYFRDDCGCGCTTSDETVCTQPSDRYVHGPAACQVALFGCDEGEQVFYDVCGCGCRPLEGAECVAPSGTAIAVTEDQIRQYWCFDFDAEPRLITTAEEYTDFINGCDGTPAEELDFDGHVYFAAVVPERTAVDFAYAVETNDGVHVGVQAEAYCGGPAPPTTVLLIEFDPTDAEFIQDRCDTGMCDPNLTPP